MLCFLLFSTNPILLAFLVPLCGKDYQNDQQTLQLQYLISPWAIHGMVTEYSAWQQPVITLEQGALSLSLPFVKTWNRSVIRSIYQCGSRLHVVQIRLAILAGTLSSSSFCCLACQRLGEDDWDSLAFGCTAVQIPRYSQTSPPSGRSRKQERGVSKYGARSARS